MLKRISRNGAFVLAISLMFQTLIGATPASAVPNAPTFQKMTLKLIADNDFAVFMGNDANVTRLFHQNNAPWQQQIESATALNIVPQAGESYLYVLAMGGSLDENWSGTINGKDVVSYPGAQVASGRNTGGTTQNNYLKLNTFFSDWAANAGDGKAIELGTYNADLGSVETALTGAIWSSGTYGSASVARASSGVCCSLNVKNNEGFSGYGWIFPTESAVMFRYPLSAAELPVSSGNGEVVVDWTSPVSGEAVVDYLVYYRETSEPDAAFKYFSVVNAPTTVATVTGLTNGTSYTFRVTARNADGVSLPTDSRAVTPTGPASQPLNLSYAALGGSIAVNFSPPENNGGFAVTNYQYSIDNGANWVTRSPVATTSPITITGLNDATTYQVKLRAITPYGFGTPSAAISALPIVNVSKTVTFAKGTLDTVTGLASTQSQAAGYVLTIPAGPTRTNFTFTGWKEGATAYQPADTYTVGASNPTFTAQWIQDSLYGTAIGDRSKKITWNISANEAIDATVSADNGNSVRVVIPANALDAGTEVIFWRLLNQNAAIANVGAGNDYLLNIGLSWSIGDDLSTPKTVQTANSPIQMTITNNLIETGAKAWKIVRGVSTLLGRATSAGVMDISFTEDPLIVAANVAPVVTNTYVQTPVPTPTKKQPPLKLAINKEILSWGELAKITLTGGVDSGTVTYQNSGDSYCIVDAASKQVVTTAYGTCIITAYNSGDSDYLQAVSNPIKILVAENTTLELDMNKVSTIYFASGTYYLNTTSKAVLNKIATSIKNKKPTEILSYGFTDSKGGTDNTYLSKMRAKSVAGYLKLKGVKTEITLGWYADANPVDTGKSKAALAKNRRVEIYIK